MVIRGLPAHGPYGNLSIVPSWLDDGPDDIPWDEADVDAGNRAKWRDWRMRLLRYRIAMRRATGDDPKYTTNPPGREAARRNELKRCADDVRYFLAVYGWIYEPRDFEDPDFPDKGWRPWAPIPPQLLILDEIDEALKYPSPEGDLLVEKSRDMGATWVFCAWVAHRWLFDTDFTAGLMSYRHAEVSQDHPDAMLYKTKAVIGLVENVPGLPPWFFPEGERGGAFANRRKELDLKDTLQHPTRTNFLKGESTTDYSGVGNRTFVRGHDEAARWPRASLRNVMTNTANTTNHRFLFSTAFVEYGDEFKRMADKLRGHPSGALGMRFLRLEPKLHPFHDDAWLIRKRRQAELNDDIPGFEREVLLDYRGGQSRVYSDALPPRDRAFDPDLVFDPSLKTIVSIDPGLADECGIVVAQVIPRPDVTNDPLWPRGAYDIRWLDAYMLAGHGMDFWAHVLTGVLPEPGDTAYPIFFDGGGRPRTDRRLRELMALTARLPRDGALIAWTGDPAGETREQTSKTTWYKECGRITREILLRDAARNGNDDARIRGIRPIARKLYKYNSYQERQIHLRPVLRRSVFANTEGPRQLWDAIDGAHKLDPTPRQQREPGMAHDPESALWTAAEYLAVWLRVSHGIGKIREEREKDEDISRIIGLPPGYRDREVA